MQNENSGEANSDSVDSKVHGEGHNILVGVNLASTDVLATEKQHETFEAVVYWGGKSPAV